MAVTSARRTPGAGAEIEAVGARLALAVADANWYTTENLFGELQRPGVATLLLNCLDYYNAWRRGNPPWRWGHRLERQSAATWRREHVLPSGWMKRFPALGMRPIRRSIADWRDRHAPDAKLALVLTYPHYLYLRDQLRPDLHVYFNIDDYSQYWPRCARRVHELERQAVREADLTVCVSRLRAEELRAAVPEAADRVRHLPHGAPSSSLAEAPCERPGPPPDDLARLPGPRLGYVGSLEDRIDWPLLDALAARFPRASVVLIGRIGSLRGPWAADARRALARPNVHALGWRPQNEIARYNRAFDVCLIPYRVDHPFNRVCCPTKIMDSMATGRPVVSTSLPECLLYSDLFDVAADSGSFLDAVASILAAGSDDGRAADRYTWARSHSCRRVADQFLDWLPLS
ncbi:MAG TPA: glycosyltransferase [Isosphaeraceae bacterium]|jgi:glycosyltransferase involved in cell wall biosynthesis|nr:glycosyltransferase [Isosphaeraceae bacterium]